VLKTKVLRRDKDLDLALLKVDGGEKFEAMELGSDKDLSELKELIAFGFPFGTALARQGEYPAITVNAGHVTSLRRDKNIELDRIQLDCALPDDHKSLIAGSFSFSTE
jgi:S1-C subfamily serine protease